MYLEKMMRAQQKLYIQIVVGCLLICAWLGWSIAQATEPTIEFYDPWWPRARLIIVEDTDAPRIPDRRVRRPRMAPAPPLAGDEFIRDISEYCEKNPDYCSSPDD